MTSFNFPIFSVIPAIILTYIPHAIRVVYLTRLSKFDNKVPRAITDQPEFAQRLLGAHNNQLEMLGVYAAAMSTAVARGKSGTQLNIYAGLYLGLRTLYVVVYAAPPVADGNVRSIVFVGCMAVVVLTWILAAF